MKAICDQKKYSQFVSMQKDCFGRPEDYSGQFLLVICRRPLRAPNPIQESKLCAPAPTLWPIIDTILIHFSIANFSITNFLLTKVFSPQNPAKTYDPDSDKNETFYPQSSSKHATHPVENPQNKITKK